MTAHQHFKKFLRAAGFKSLNLVPTIGGATKDTPRQLTYLMLIGDDGWEYRLGLREEPFVFDLDGSFKGGDP